MYKLKLIKACSYDGKVKATAENPFVTVEMKEDAEYLTKLGIFELLGTFEEDGGEAEKPSIDKMKKAELEAFAAENGIDLSDCSNNDEKKAKIKAALEEDGGEADYGEE